MIWRQEVFYLSFASINPWVIDEDEDDEACG